MNRYTYLPVILNVVAVNFMPSRQGLNGFLALWYFLLSITKRNNNYDSQVLTLPSGSQPAQVAVDLYDPQTLVRLPAAQGGQPLPHEAVIIWQP